MYEWFYDHFTKHRRKCSQEQFLGGIILCSLFLVVHASKDEAYYLNNRPLCRSVLLEIKSAHNTWKLKQINKLWLKRIEMSWKFCNTLIVFNWIWSYEKSNFGACQLLYERVECPKTDKNMRNETMKGAPKRKKRSLMLLVCKKSIDFRFSW